MPEPTYKAEQQGERTVYTCLIPDASSPEGLCGHQTYAEDMMTLHMGQRHAGQMIQAPEEAGSAEGTDADVSQQPPASVSSPPPAPDADTPSPTEADDVPDPTPPQAQEG